jgi:hypothetical protein
VRDAYLGFAGGISPDLWLMLGDNAYNSGTDAEYQVGVFDVYQTPLRSSVLWPTLGNHDGVSADSATQSGPYYDIFSLPAGGEAGGVASGTEAYYSFDYGRVHFVCLDSYESGRAPAVPMLQWLASDLHAAHADWTIAFWHHPPYTKGSHNSDSFSDSEGRMFWMRERVNPILESYGVDLVLCGHSHNYERSFPLDGHYGMSGTLDASMIKDSGNGRAEDTGPYIKRTSAPEGNQGTIYVVAGSSGWATFVQALPHPAMYTTLLQLGSMVVDVDGSRMDAKFLRETGAVDDWFTILKSHEPGPFVVSKFRIIGGRVFARLGTTVGKTYRVLRTPGLESPSWTPVSGDIKATGQITSWSGPVEAGAEKAFYRAEQSD